MRLNLSGELIADEWAEVYRWWGYEAGFYCPSDVRNALAKLPDGEELVLEINSVGGVVDCAAEIYSVISAAVASGVTVRAEIQSLAASAASYYILACSRIDISLPAQMMIHCAGWDVGGNKHAHEWAAQALDVTDASILDVYCRKCGDKCDRAELERMMEAETYIGARRCLELGLVDGIIGEETGADGAPLALVASITDNVTRAMRTLPDIRDLIARRDNRNWQDQARIDLEHCRY